MRDSWSVAMLRALASTMAHPDWWAMALAAFLVRGGIVLVAVAIVPLPSPAAIATELTPLIDALAFGNLGTDDILFFASLGAIVLGAVGLALSVGGWLDLTLTREATEDEELELAWRPARMTATEALMVRFSAHVPTVLLGGYGLIRLISATYDELLSPGDPNVEIVLRILARAPDGVILPVVAWVTCEAIGALAVRRTSAGQRSRAALVAAIRQVLRPRGLATVAVTTAALALVLVPLLVGVARSMEQVHASLLRTTDTVQLLAALLLLVASWVLGLAVLGAALAWRSAAWTVEVEPPAAPSPIEGTPGPEAAVTPA